jgi:hypothetical protein
MRKSTINIVLALIAGVGTPCLPQANPDLQTYFKEYIGLRDNQIKAIRSGKAFAKTLHSRTPAEIFVFGAIYINARPETYVKFAQSLDHLRNVSGYLAIGKFNVPPQISDLRGFTLDSEDIKSLKRCKPGDCEIQMPASSIEDVQQSTDWSARNVAEQVNQVLQETALERLAAYQREGNPILGVYNDKQHPTDASGQFEYMLSYARALPKSLPDLYGYLLSYPRGKPTNVEDMFYWAKVKFGLKPTLRILHVVTMLAAAANEPAYVIAEKQLYSSHYFQTALDLTFCISDISDPKQHGFYLVKAMGSEQAGLTGFKGSIVRKIAVDRSASSLQKSLTVIKNALEQNQ